FSDYDDHQYVSNNPHLTRGLSFQDVAWLSTHSYSANWHPLTWISHMLDVQMFGLHAGGHHAVNVLWHIANSILLFLALTHLTRARWPCALVAALFAWHPLHVESVAWIAERKDLLSTFFGI